MAQLIVKAGHQPIYVGFSHEEKPTTEVTPGTRFIELDTGDEFLCEGSRYSDDGTNIGVNMGGGTWHRLASSSMRAAVERLDRIETQSREQTKLLAGLYRAFLRAHDLEEDDLADDIAELAEESAE